MDFAFISCIGNRVINEDSYSVKEKNGSYCFTVCDGLGGHAKGEVASKCAAQTFSDKFESFEGNIPEFFEAAFDEAAENFRKLAGESPVLELMKTTVVSLVICGSECGWAHIGDSRLYGFHNGEAVLCTTDHSVPEMLVKTGEIKQSDIRNHPDRNKLLRAFGVSDETPAYEIGDLKDLSDYDAFLLCSDGFWELINERKAEKCLKHSQNAEHWLSEMIKQVEHKGRRREMDNYTAIAVITEKGGK